jgi:hypothetical protein
MPEARAEHADVCYLIWRSVLFIVNSVKRIRMNEAETRSFPVHLLPCSNVLYDSYAFQPHHTSKKML